MSIFGNGVGGGLLAAAGAAQGLGSGAVQVGQQQQKADLAQKMSDLEQTRDEALERLRGQEQEKLQASNIQAGKDQESQRETFETGQTNTRLTAASAAAGKTRDFEATQNAAKLSSEEKRTGITAQSRIDAANVRASASAGNKEPPKQWEVHNVNKINPAKPLDPPTQTQVLFNNRTGASYMQVGDKLIRFNSQTGNAAVDADPKRLSRAPAADVQDLLRDPLGKVPSGPNAGLSKSDLFEATHNYLPATWPAAAQQAEQQQRAPGPQSLPKGVLNSVGGPGASSTKVGAFGGGTPGADEDDGAENAAQSDEDASSAAPAFRSSAMDAFNQ